MIPSLGGFQRCPPACSTGLDPEANSSSPSVPGACKSQCPRQERPLWSHKSHQEQRGSCTSAEQTRDHNLIPRASSQIRPCSLPGLVRPPASIPLPKTPLQRPVETHPDQERDAEMHSRFSQEKSPSHVPTQCKACSSDSPVSFGSVNSKSDLPHQLRRLGTGGIPGSFTPRWPNKRNFL